MLESSPFGIVLLESSLATDSVMRCRGASSGGGTVAEPVSLLRFLEGVDIESGVSASDCWMSGSRRERSLRFEEAGMVHEAACSRTRAYVEGQLRGMGESRKAAELKEMVAEKEWRGELGIGLAEWWWC